MKTFVIAEAGVNHNGNLQLALEMVRCAAAAGADAVKFQTFRAEDLVTRDAPTARYQRENDGSVTQYEMLKRLELSPENHQTLIEECKKHGIEFMSTPFSIESAKLLQGLGMKTWKIPSGEITNLPLLRFIGSLDPEKIILSTGMSTLVDIDNALTALYRAGAHKERTYLLHCTTAYPTPYCDVNLKAMDVLRRFETAGVGYSDHTPGIVVPMAAVALGATIIEKHFTLDRNLEGPDHNASLMPHELAQMIRDIRTVEDALGFSTKRPAKSECGNLNVARKSVVASRDIAKGEPFTENNLTTKRPGTGISPMKWDELMGRRARHDYITDQQINEDEIR